MKTKLILFILILNCANSAVQSQRVWLTENLDAYVGTWVYQKNDTVFKVSLQKSLQVGGIAAYDVLLGGYSLSVKGIVVEYYMKNYPSSIDLKTRTKWDIEYIWATNSSSEIETIDPNELRMIFYDQRKRHFDGKGIAGGRIKLLSPDKIHWYMNEKRGIRLEAEIIEDINPDSYPPIGFSVPFDVIMTKEK